MSDRGCGSKTDYPCNLECFHDGMMAGASVEAVAVVGKTDGMIPEVPAPGIASADAAGVVSMTDVVLGIGAV